MGRAVNKWDKRYEQGDPAAARPARVLSQNAHLLPQMLELRSQRALDLAAGLGGNAIYLAKRGWQVDALDHSAVACAKLDAYAHQNNLAINAEQRDVESQALARTDYQLIVCSYYLHRPLLHKLADYLAPNGVLFYQTWTVEKLTEKGPSNPEFLLQVNELLSAFQHLRVLRYEEPGRVGDLTQGGRNEASIVAMRPA